MALQSASMSTQPLVSIATPRGCVGRRSNMSSGDFPPPRRSLPRPLPPCPATPTQARAQPSPPGR
eukprot:2616705-Alexandrium_andersonii.AAC.1